MSIRYAVILVLAALAVPADARAPSPRAVDAVLSQVYGRYARESDPRADWEVPVWSREMRGLFKQWRSYEIGEVTNLSSYGWFCECQDWDSRNFKWKRVSMELREDGRLEVAVHIEAGWDATSDQRLVLRREAGRWKIDDLVSESEPDGLKAAMRLEISELANGQ